ncbi:hypothetical protein Glove_174g146 [Diversispora epigaea]|uniref:Uncharacterized protein n=1 Tax=Diversispora epigaea TaxID=1348612 RepID=A0A397INR5_9GLOM|nr:hypothetical protein Glove_174g146 [Diversispora epigaea]
MVTLSELCGTSCTNKEYYEYCKMESVRSDEIPRLILLSDGTLYALKNGFTICHNYN